MCELLYNFLWVMTLWMTEYVMIIRNDSGIASMEIEILKIVNCGICDEEFLTNSKLENHVKSEHFNEENSTLQ